MIFREDKNKIEIIFDGDNDKNIKDVKMFVEKLKLFLMGSDKDLFDQLDRNDDRIITEDRMAQRIVLEVLLHKVNNITIKEAKNIASIVSVKIRNAFYYIKKQGLVLTDKQANSLEFWVKQVVNSGKDINQE